MGFVFTRGTGGREGNLELLGSEAAVMKMESTVTIEQTIDGAMIKVTTPQCDWIKQHPTSEDAIAEAVKLGLVTKRIASILANRGNRCLAFLGKFSKLTTRLFLKMDSRRSLKRRRFILNIERWAGGPDLTHNKSRCPIIADGLIIDKVGIRVMR
jgi:hypothetical protein